MPQLLSTIRKLNNNKAPGKDRVTAEHLKNMGPIAVELLTTIINRCFNTPEELPEAMTIGTIIPIHKKKTPDKTDPNGYRGLTLLSTFAKVLEAFIKDKITNTLQDTDVPDALQGGFQQNRSCAQIASVLDMVIEFKASTGHESHVVFLDASKAFDVVNHRCYA